MVVWGGEGGHLFSLGKGSSLSFSLSSIHGWRWHGDPPIPNMVEMFFEGFTETSSLLEDLLFILDLISDSLFSLSLSHFSALVYLHHQSNFVGW